MNKPDPEVLEKLGVGRRRTLRRWLFRVSIVVILASLVVAVLTWRKRAAAQATVSWVTAPVELGDLRETVTATGTLSPLDAVEVGAEVTGRVVQIHVDINEQVKAARGAGRRELGAAQERPGSSGTTAEVRVQGERFERTPTRRGSAERARPPADTA